MPCAVGRSVERFSGDGEIEGADSVKVCRHAGILRKTVRFPPEKGPASRSGLLPLAGLLNIMGKGSAVNEGESGFRN